MEVKPQETVVSVPRDLEGASAMSIRVQVIFRLDCKLVGKTTFWVNFVINGIHT